MKFRVFNYSWSVGLFFIILGIISFLLLMAIFVVEGVLRHSYNREVLQYFSKEFIQISQEYQKIAILIFILKQLITWFFILLVLFLIWKFIPSSSEISIIKASGYIMLFVVTQLFSALKYDFPAVESFKTHVLIVFHRFLVLIKSLTYPIGTSSRVINTSLWSLSLISFREAASKNNSIASMRFALACSTVSP